MFLHRIASALDNAKVPYALVGGFAVALHGAIRGTMDVDIVLRLTAKDYEKAEAAFHSLGLQSRLPVTASQVFHFRDEYIKNRNLNAWSFYNPTRHSEILDVIITSDLSALKIIKIPSGKLTLKVTSIEDLIAMKKQSGRPQDLQDIHALKKILKKKGDSP